MICHLLVTMVYSNSQPADSHQVPCPGSSRQPAGKERIAPWCNVNVQWQVQAPQCCHSRLLDRSSFSTGIDNGTESDSVLGSPHHDILLFPMCVEKSVVEAAKPLCRAEAHRSHLPRGSRGKGQSLHGGVGLSTSCVGQPDQRTSN